MVAAYRITANGQDITTALAQRLLRISLRDEAGLKNDRLEITLHDRPPYIAMPEAGTKFKVWLGYPGQRVYKGEYTLDETKCGDEPTSFIRMTARAGDTGGTIKKSRSRSWHETTIASVINTVAAEHKLTPKVDPALGQTRIQHRDQSAQSDMSFISRLAQEHDAIMKIADGNLYFGARDKYKSVTGKPLAEITIDKTQCSRYSYGFQSRGKYSGVRARYLDRDEGEEYYVNSGDDDGAVHTLPEVYPTRDRAQAAANARGNSLGRSEENFEFTVAPGNPSLEAETHVNMTGFRPGVRTDWLLSSVDHMVDATGAYTTQAQAEKAKGKAGKKKGSSPKGAASAPVEYYAFEGEDAPKKE